MLRIISAAALAFAFVAPASAQSVRELSGDTWSCRLTSLIGEPSGDMTIAFGRTGTLDATFYFEVPNGDDIVSMNFGVTGAWSLNDTVITMSVNDTELLGAWINDVDLDAETKADMAVSIDDQMTSFSGESSVAYIAKNALVLEESDTSMSCWR